jgi:sulfhydrogenase subunit delta
MLTKPKLAVWKFASCDGCQLSLLDCEDELLTLCDEVEIAHFTEATRRELPPPYDVSLVEGSVTTSRDLTRIQTIRRQSRWLIAIGACATAGGIQALRNFGSVTEFAAAVYARPEYIDSLATSTPIEAHVKVDYQLRGCPVNKRQLLEVVSAFVRGRSPTIGSYSVCQECKLAGHVCVLVAQGTACLGPVTHAGCGAICPGYNRGCYGCYGPQDHPNSGALSARLRLLGATSRELVHLYRNFNAADEEFRAAGEAVDQ